MSNFKVGDKVRAKHDIIDGDDFVCAKAGDVGTIVEVVDDDAFDVNWPGAGSITGLDEIEPVRFLRAVA